jgi:hypothetical protein
VKRSDSIHVHDDGEAQSDFVRKPGSGEYGDDGKCAKGHVEEDALELGFEKDRVRRLVGFGLRELTESKPKPWIISVPKAPIPPLGRLSN